MTVENISRESSRTIDFFFTIIIGDIGQTDKITDMVILELFSYVLFVINFFFQKIHRSCSG